MIKPTPSNPLFVFGTRHGSIFNLTPSNLPNIPGIQLSVGDFFDFKQTLKQLPQNISFKKFLGFPESTVTYLTPYDFYKKECMSGCQNNSIVKIKCSKGYTEFTAKEYDQMIDIIKPDIAIGLTEYPQIQKNHVESNKSLKRAINKTSNYFEKSQLFKVKSQKLLRMAALHGGRNLSLINRSLQFILNHEVDGIMVCDLCDLQSLQEREQVFKTIKQRLQKDGRQLVLGLAGLGKIPDITHALQFGYSIFQVNYPFLLAEKQIALIQTAENTYIEHTPVRHQQLTPLSATCKCQTCARHSQAYIAHLTECFQMNAKVYLSIHNLQNYVQFMAKFK